MSDPSYLHHRTNPRMNEGPGNQSARIWRKVWWMITCVPGRPKVASFKFAISFTIIIFLSVATLTYCLYFENWTLRDTLYFSVITFTSVGYGTAGCHSLFTIYNELFASTDIYPTSNGARIFTIVFVILGHSIIGIVIGYVGHHWYLRKTQTLLRNQRDYGYGRNHNNRRLRQPRPSILQTILQRRRETSSSSSGISNSLSKFFERACSKFNSSENSVREERPWLVSIFSTVCFCKDVMIILFPSMVAIGFAAVIVGYIEKWTWYDALYWATMTGTTMGYGEITPSKSEAIWFCIFYIPILVILISVAIGNIAGIFINREIERFNVKLIRREPTIRDLEVMNTDGDHEVTRMEFIEHFLMMLKKVDAELMDELHSQFHKLDVDGSGTLSAVDIEQMTEQKLRMLLRQNFKRQKKSRRLVIHDDLSSSSEDELVEYQYGGNGTGTGTGTGVIDDNEDDKKKGMVDKLALMPPQAAFHANTYDRIASNDDTEYTSGYSESTPGLHGSAYYVPVPVPSADISSSNEHEVIISRQDPSVVSLQSSVDKA